MDDVVVGAAEHVFAIARREPGRAAIHTTARSVTYGELAARARTIASGIRARGVGRGDIVAVCTPRDERLPAALIGVLASGAAYLPLDPRNLSDRSAAMMADAAVALVLTSDDLVARLPGPKRPLLTLPLDPSGPTADEVAPKPAPADLAYVLYTSGSTGTPKGVCVEHGSLAAYLDGTRQHLGDADLAVAAAVASAEFDYSLHELLVPLVRGGSIALAEDLLALPEHPAYEQVTLVHGVPTPMAMLLERPLPPAVRAVVFGGEPLPPPLIERAFANPAVERVYNFYGPTETTIAATGVAFGRGETPRTTIGAPLPGVTAAVLDPDGRPVADGEIGELYLAGPQVARGYLGRPDLTAAAFRTGVPGLPGRAYRTGDLVAWTGTGFAYHGRGDEQVKVRGHRIELPEVEAALLALDGVGQAGAVLVDTPSGADLAAVIVPDDPELDTDAVVAAAAQRLPDFLRPSRFVLAPSLPTTTAGKVDRRHLARLAAQAPHLVDHDLPTDPEERLVAVAIETVLGRRPDPGRPLAAQGVHSLTAARAALALACETGKALRPSDFLGEARVADVAEVVRRTRAVEPTPAVEVAVGQDVDLTAIQRALWLRRRISSDPAVTAVAGRMRLDPDPGRDAIRDALVRLSDLHPSLRTAVVEGDTGPVGRLLAPGVDLVDLRGGGSVDAFLAEPVVLDGSGPPLRAALVDPAPGSGDGVDLVVQADHLALDGWSLGVIAEGLAEVLAGRTVARPPVPWAIASPRSGEVSADLDAIVAGSHRPADPLGRGVAAAATAPGRGRRVTRRAAWRREDIDAYAARLGVTPAAVHLAVTGVVLARLTRHHDLLVGLAVARRHLPGADRVVAPLLSVLPARLVIDPERCAEDVVRSAASAVTAALRLVDVEPEQVAAAFPGLPAGAVPLPVLLTVQPDGPLTVEADGQRIDMLGELDCGSAQADLTIMINATVAGPELIVEHDAARLPAPAEVDAFADRYVRVLGALLAAPETPAGRLPVLSPSELDRLDRLTDGPALEAPVLDVTSAIWARAAATPHAVATESAAPGGLAADRIRPPERLTYAEVIGLADATAAALRRHGVEPGDVVAVALPRDARLPAALLGVLAAGAAYQPWHRDYPPQRLAFVAADAGVRTVLTCPRWHDRVAAVPADRPLAIVDLPATHGQPTALPSAPPAFPEEAAAYVLHTSGSTGTPKGVVVSRRNLSWLAHSVLQAGVVPRGARVLLSTPMTFDISVAELWPVLMSGGTVVVAGDDLARDGTQFAEVVDAAGVAVVQATPNGLRLLTAGGWRGGPVTVLSCGEALPADVAGQVVDRSTLAWNLYGPTEATVYATALAMTPEHVADARRRGAPMSIGRPLPGARVRITGPDRRVLPPGCVGELWIGGPGVSAGYLDRPEQTAGAFAPTRSHRLDELEIGWYATGDLACWLPDDTLDFRGRRDAQLKVNGYRIEPAEVEARLRAHPAVADASVGARIRAGAAVLTAWVVPALGQRPASEGEFLPDATRAELTAHASATLPAHLVPALWIALPALPVTSSGKIDRAALAVPTGADTKDDLPDGPVEEAVADIWSRVLGCRIPSRTADFFALGGHSLAATRVVVAIDEEFALRVPVSALLASPRLADFATVVTEALLGEMAP